MGGCAGKPKDLDTKQEPLIQEESTTPKKAEGETAPQENNGGETKNEEPLVDLTEKAPEAAKSEEPAAEPKPAAESNPAAESMPVAESKLEVVPEDEAKVEKNEVEAPAAAPAAPASEDKSDAPLVTL